MGYKKSKLELMSGLKWRLLLHNGLKAFVKYHLSFYKANTQIIILDAAKMYDIQQFRIQPRNHRKVSWATEAAWPAADDCCTTHGCVKSTVIERRQHHLGRMADIPSSVTFSVFFTYKIMRYHKLNLRPCGTHWWI